jgi:outer membrane protein assembly factor BamB
MKTYVAFVAATLAYVAPAAGQGRPVDWASAGGDAQRTGWEKGDVRITKDNVKDFRLVLKRKFESSTKGAQSLTPPVVIGNLISYRGFKELAFIAGSDNRVWSIDADLDRVFWHKQLDAPPTPKSNCPAQAVATPALTPPANFGAGRGPRPAGAAPARPATAPVAFGAPRPVYVISTDGKLHRVNTSDGSDQLPPIDFLPAGSRASVITLADGYAYTTTTTACGGKSNAVWALDLSATDPKPVNYALTSEPAGFAVGTDGTVYVQASKLVALSGGDLTLKNEFTFETAAATPVVFAHQGHDLVVSAGKDGRLHLLDSTSMLSHTEPLSTEGHGVWGGLSSWQDADGVRWVLAPVWGPAKSATHGSIMAFKVEDQNGKPALTPVWTSEDMVKPQPPVITSGVVFALSSGDKHATLYALDAATGTQLYTTGSQATAPANLTGVTLANGRVFFTTTDNTLYGFGIFLER